MLFRSVSVTFKGGASLDPADVPGLASMTAKMLREGGTKKLPPAEFDETLDFLANYSDPPPLCYAWLNLTRYNGAPALIGFTSGNAARLVETMSDDEVVANVMQQIRTHAGGATAPASGRIPDPVQVRISRWGSDPLARGSYSFLGLGGSGGDRDRLAVPVGNTLFFAGEATHRNDPASVHGAWWSGQRAARQIQTVA